ncbi:MAG: penicillin-binding protein 1C, partial [Caulobacteraceae bacterium]|nr:penicillin-binding protein 1C [Caulobacter sp.]
MNRPSRTRRVLAAALLAVVVSVAACWGALHLVPLPAGLELSPAPSLLVTDARGEVLRELPVDGHYARPPLPLDQIPLALRQATIAAEDKRFYAHGGVDFLALGRAVTGQFGWRRAGERRSGGSTITEQLIKLSQPRPRTVWTKLVEAVQALRLEQVWTKDRILAAYLNRLDYGNRDLGCAAAARHYFGKRPTDLSTAEAALLAALPQSPTRLNPFRHLERARARQQWVLQRMGEAPGAAADEIARARVEPLRLAARARPFEAPHFVEHLLAAGGPLPANARREVATTLDLGLNRFVTDALRQHLAGLRAQRVGNGAAVVIDNRTGGVLALVGSADFFSPRGGQIDGAWARRSPGSTIKPFTYLLAFERGATPADVVDDLPAEFPSSGAVYRPENYSHRFYGPMRLRPALANSLNISAVRVLADKAGGPSALWQRLRACGLTTLPLPADHYGLGLTLGNAEARLLELTDAYACLARLGEYRRCRWFQSGRDPQASVRLTDPCSAYLLADILADNGARALSFGVDSDLRWDFPVACKTGTSTDFRDNWAMGYTPEFTVGVWVGNFDGRPMLDVSGVTGAGPILHEVF